MKRYQKDIHITYRNWKNHIDFHIDFTQNEVGVSPRNSIKCPCDNQMGRFHKKDAYDCGKTKCFTCHYHKFPKRIPTYQEKCSNLKLIEGINDLREN